MKSATKSANAAETIKAMTAITTGVSKIAAARSSKKPAAKKPAAPKSKAKGNPYREGGLRFAIFAAGAKGYSSRKELAAKIGKVRRVSALKVGFQIAVVASANHPGNAKRSKEIEKGDEKFLVAC